MSLCLKQMQNLVKKRKMEKGWYIEKLNVYIKYTFSVLWLMICMQIYNKLASLMDKRASSAPNPLVWMPVTFCPSTGNKSYVLHISEIKIRTMLDICWAHLFVFNCCNTNRYFILRVCFSQWRMQYKIVLACAWCKGGVIDCKSPSVCKDDLYYLHVKMQD